MPVVDGHPPLNRFPCIPSYPFWPQAVGWCESQGSTDFIGPICMKKNCPGKKGLSSFSDQLYENITDPFAQRARMLWLSKTAIAHAFKVFVWRNVGPLRSKGWAVYARHPYSWA